MNDDSISREALRRRMYHEAFEVDNGMQRWDSGLWIRYKIFENAIEEAPVVEPETEIIRCHECRYNDGGYCSMLRERTKRNGVEVRIWSQFFCAYGEKEEKK